MRSILLFLLALPAFALSNRITVYDTATLTHTSEPRSDTRGFADFEFCVAYPQPYISGVAATAWQVDVLNNWPSGCIRQATISYFLSISSGGNTIVDFRPNVASSSGGTTPLSKAAMLAFNSSNWGAKIQGTASGVVRSASARTILNAVSQCPAGEWAAAGCYRYLLSGPVVTQIVLFGGTTNSFGWECDSSGGTCPAVSPYTSTAWKTPTSSSYDSIHPMWIISFYTGWAGVKTNFIIENPWFGRGQDQRFDLALFNGGSETNSVYTSTGLVFYAWRRAYFTYWDGATPAGWTSHYRPGTRVDFNRQYMLYSRLIPFQVPTINGIGVAGTYDLNSSQANLDIVHNIGSATEMQFCVGGGAQCGPQAYSWPQGGSKPEIAPISRSYSRYLVAYSDELYEVMMQVGLAAGAMPFHIRESSTGLTYTSGHAANAFGKPISLDSRPLMRFGNTQTGVPVGSRFQMGEGVVGTIACQDASRSGTIGCTVTDGTQAFNRWTIDDAHPPRAAYIPYVITGDFYFLEEQMFATTQTQAVGGIGSAIVTGCNASFVRHGEAGVGNDWGLPANAVNIRVEAWNALHQGQTVLSLPDGSPEKIYYNSRLQKLIDVRRGTFNITPSPSDWNPGGSALDPCPTGGYNPATATPWCWGRRSLMENKLNPLNLMSFQGTYAGWGLNSTAVACATNQWFEHYMNTSFGMLNDFGLTQFEPFVRRMSERLIKQAIGSNALGSTMGDYSMAIRKVSDGEPVQTVAEINALVKTSVTLTAGISSSDTTIPISKQVSSVGCSATDSIWMGGLTKWVIDKGTVDEEWIELNVAPACQGAGPYSFLAARRGIMGSTAKAHLTGAVVQRGFVDYGGTASQAMDSGYATIANGAFSFAYPYTATDEVTGARLSGRRAWETHRSMMISQEYLTDTTCTSAFVNANNCQNFMWQFRPRHLVENVRTVAGAGQVQFWYTAPTADGCKIGVSATAFSNSDDSGDTASTGNSLSRTLTVTGLSTGTYFYRITCGPFGGTARATGSFVL